MLKPVIDITTEEFQPYTRLNLIYGARQDQREAFVITRVGRIAYAVSVDHGFAYTRLQFIQKYGRVCAGFLLSEPL